MKSQEAAGLLVFIRAKKKQKTRATPTWHNTPVDFHEGRHILKGVIS